MEVIIKTTTACNGTCVYCSADASETKKGRFPVDKLELFFERFAAWQAEDECRIANFVWHGGEPLLAGPEFFREVRRQQRSVFGEEQWRYSNSIQSNLSLIDSRWIPVLTELVGKETIGTSFDLVPGVRGVAGNDDFDRCWLTSIKTLMDNGFRVGVIYVAHKRSLDMARELYYFFRNVNGGTSLRFNPMYAEGRGAGELSRDLQISPEEYGRFLVDVCDVWYEDSCRSTVNPLAEWHSVWRGESTGRCCDTTGRCHETHLGIDPDGTVHGCGRASDNAAFPLGNIFEEELVTILERPPRKDLANRSPRLNMGACADCPYWTLCNGGCPVMAWLYFKDLFRETYFCQSRRMLFSRFEELFGPPAFQAAPAIGIVG